MFKPSDYLENCAGLFFLILFNPRLDIRVMSVTEFSSQY